MSVVVEDPPLEDPAELAQVFPREREETQKQQLEALHKSARKLAIKGEKIEELLKLVQKEPRLVNYSTFFGYRSHHGKVALEPTLRYD